MTPPNAYPHNQLGRPVRPRVRWEAEKEASGLYFHRVWLARENPDHAEYIDIRW